jgi:hypothetical protein
MLFKKLSETEIADYRKWARENYKPMTEIKGIWHPVVQAECVLINSDYEEKGSFLADLVKGMDEEENGMIFVPVNKREDIEAVHETLKKIFGE